MSPFLPSTALHRITLRRRLLTAHLYLHDGSFWEAVEATRANWGLAAEPALPLFVPDEHGIIPGLAVSVPKEWPAKPPVSRLPPRYPNEDGFEVPSLMAAMVLPLEWGPCRLAWWIELKRLHDWFIPDDARSSDPMPEQTWAPFFSQCVLYDPPKDRLLEYADTAPVKVDFAPMPVGTKRTGLPDTAGPSMINAPIVTIRNGDDVELVFFEMYEDLFHRMDHELRQAGIDIFALRTWITETDPSIFERFRERLREVRTEHYIAVRPETTQDDVRAAFQLLKQEMPTRRATRKQSKTTKSNPLTCIQCALWYDGGKSHGEIAAHFGWTVQTDRTLNQWSESARAHIARGRQILKADPEMRSRLLLGQD